MAAQQNIKEQIKRNSRYMVVVFGVLGIAIFTKIFYLQQYKKQYLVQKLAVSTKTIRVINATRGNVYASDGLSLLATSVPKYLPILDASQARQTVFDEGIDSLAYGLSSFFQDRSALEYKEKILKSRAAKSKYMIVGNRKINHQDKMLLAKLPLFRLGPYKGGGRFEKEEHRFLPLQNLAMRTIGKMKKDLTNQGEFGIEASFENYLHGKDGRGYYERLAGGYYKPVDLDSDINAEQGLDVITTLDVNFQDIAESALRNQVVSMQAKYGTAVIMEINTGHVKAIANLSRTTNKEGAIEYIEDQNYAVKEGTDPGSTFKLASIAAILEKSGIALDEPAVNCLGQVKHADRIFTCSHEHGSLTVQQVFEKSCNIGIYNLMKKHFGFENPDDYFAFLDKFRLNKPSGFQLKGEPLPVIKNRKSSTYSKTTVPWMSIGYESRITPLQMLTFYNAIANNGRWVQPIIVKEIRKGSRKEQIFEANIINEPMVSSKTIAKLRTLMEGVVQNGTAKNINYGNCMVAGKTGTSQKRVNGDYRKGSYYTSFIGYFPANRPRYSCIVVINEPLGSNLYAADVSAPVFKTIAEKIFAYDISMHPRFTVKSNVQHLQKTQNAGRTQDVKIISDKLGINNEIRVDGFTEPKIENGNPAIWKSKNADKNIENIIGLNLKDALPLLENKGYSVRFSGMGKVKSYSFIGKNALSLNLQ